MMTALNIPPSQRRFHALIGTGGIGHGTFFELMGNHTLGREESRSGRFLDRHDYCKLHIITHYVQTLMGEDFVTIPIGKVGDDLAGRRLIGEMEEAGLELRYVQCEPNAQTLYSFCIIYPDGSGGNLTVDNSACADVDVAFIFQAQPEFEVHQGYGIALAVPEVPLDARKALLEFATQYEFFRTASFTSEEIVEAKHAGLLLNVDLLAINLDEAAALAGVPAGLEPESIVTNTISLLHEINPQNYLSVTAGINGSWTWDGEELMHLPSHEVEVKSTAGAGDALFAGLLVGLAAGLKLKEAHEFGNLVAALSVTCPHTIHKDIDLFSLSAFSKTIRSPLSENVRNLIILEDEESNDQSRIC